MLTFSTVGRLNRVQYIGYFLVNGIIQWYLNSSRTSFYSSYLFYRTSFALIITLIFVLFVLGTISAAIFISATVRRFHDLNRSGTNVWLLSIPFYNFYLLYRLLFDRGTRGINYYGSDPLSNPLVSQDYVHLSERELRMLFSRNTSTEKIVSNDLESKSSEINRIVDNSAGNYDKSEFSIGKVICWSCSKSIHVELQDHKLKNSIDHCHYCGVEIRDSDLVFCD